MKKSAAAHLKVLSTMTADPTKAARAMLDTGKKHMKLTRKQLSLNTIERLQKKLPRRCPCSGSLCTLMGQMRRPSGLSIGGTWGQWRSRGEENKNWRIQTLFSPLVWLWCVSKWKWGQCCHHFYFLTFTFFASLKCSSLLWNATDEGAIAPKALVYVQINVKFNFLQFGG